MNQARMRVLVQEPFYQHDRLGPGAPLTAITGQGEGNGYYDWAGRRLFLADGEPDPMCPGAYRYQHNPDACDLEAPDSDPRSPRYEPMHLRHRPGDTWIIDSNRPHDPFDPGPYGSPGWYKDERTGRHRRDETPDPLPAENWTNPGNAWYPGTSDWPEPEPPQQEPPRRNGRCSGGGSDRPPPTTGTGWRPVPSDPEDDDGGRSARRFWDRGGSGDSDPRDAGWISGSCEVDRQSGTDTGGEFRFSKPREDAFDRFIVKSAELRAAHFAPEKPYFRERLVWALRWVAWVVGLGLVAMPEPLATSGCRPGPGTARSVAPQSFPAPEEIAVMRLEHAPRLVTVRESAGAANPEHAPRPGAAIAAAIGGARAARKVIAERQTRTSDDLAAAVRDSAAHWRVRPSQKRPRLSPRPAPRSDYVTAWELAFDHAFDTGRILILGIGGTA
ncbi:hypothetical protein [Glycomyces sp. NPDC048151]|uniref:hypothetical protein n=1 Tax=Glycomyces sp. NPDC048151 TaxID=3364002 RepID=UPI0037192BF0